MNRTTSTIPTTKECTLVYSNCHNKNHSLGGFTRSIFSDWRLESPRSRSSKIWFLVRAYLLAWRCNLLISSSHQEREGFSLFIRPLILSRGPHPHAEIYPHSFGKAPCPDTITLKVRTSIYASFGGAQMFSSSQSVSWHCKDFRVIPEQRLLMLPFSKRSAFSSVLNDDTTGASQVSQW